MPRPGIGNPGNKGGLGGSAGFGLQAKTKKLKRLLFDAILEDCENKPHRKLYWAERCIQRLLPQTVEGSGEKGEFIIKIAQEIADKNETYSPPLLTINSGEGQD